jgi:hypothetical protein
MSGRGRRLRAWLAIASAVALLASALVGFGSSAAQAIALSGSDFQPGSIISDAMFYDTATMTSAQIQGFLASEEPSCSPGYTCLASFSQDTVSHAADSRCAAYTGVAGQLASDIIYNVSQACGINPQVLVVLLQKEQGLVTSSSPSTGAYNAATGYYCPGACNAAYAGFENQVYGAAHQFKIYQSSPTSFNYRAGQNNSIAWSPNSACGTTNVYIQNQATAGLYDYTPYVPDAAALANINGTGDGCSSYGNRNFWVYFSEWFGNAQGGGSFAKSASDPTIYLLTADHKYPVPSQDVLNSYWALGPYRTVSDSYLAEFTTGPNLGPLIRDPTTGSIYYSDLGIKHYVSSCSELVNYATSCANYIDLLPSQIQLLASGADLNQFARSAVTGAIYYVNAGVKRWVHSMNDVINLNGGQTPPFMNLSQTTLASIPDGPDYVGVGTVIQAVGGTALYLVDANNRLVPIPSAGVAGEFAANGVTLVSPATLTADTVDNSASLTLVVTCGAASYIEGGGSLWKLTANSAYGLPTTALDPSTCAALPHAQSVPGALFIRSSATGAIYYVVNGAKSHLSTMSAVYSLNGRSSLVMVPLGEPAVDEIPVGRDLLGPTALVKSASGATVYMVDGLNKKIPIDLFQTAAEFGINGYSIVPDAVLGPYTSSSADLSIDVSCDGSDYVAGGGELWRLLSDSSGLTVTTLDPITCNALAVSPQSVSGILFFRSPSSGAIYSISNGHKTYMASMAAVNALNGGVPPVLVPLSDTEIAKIP